MFFIYCLFCLFLICSCALKSKSKIVRISVKPEQMEERSTAWYVGNNSQKNQIFWKLALLRGKVKKLPYLLKYKTQANTSFGRINTRRLLLGSKVIVGSLNNLNDFRGLRKNCIFCFISGWYYVEKILLFRLLHSTTFYKKLIVLGRRKIAILEKYRRLIS